MPRLGYANEHQDSLFSAENATCFCLTGEKGREGFFQVTNPRKESLHGKRTFLEQMLAKRG